MFRPRRLVQSVLALLLLAVFADSAAATEARLLALGADGDFLEDVGHARRWYGCLASYPDLVLAELGDYLPASSGQPRLRRQSAGAHLALDAPGRWGTAALYLQADDADEGGAEEAGDGEPPQELPLVAVVHRQHGEAEGDQRRRGEKGRACTDQPCV